MKPKAPAKSKRLNYELIPRGTSEGQPMYQLLARLVDEHHDELRGARIALAWCLTWKPDPDGRVTIGRCKRASALDRELAPYDFVILLSAEFWRDPLATDHHRLALLDHELCHATVRLDKDGEPVEDARGRAVFRTRKHDVEEFAQIVERYGTYKRDIEQFATALSKSKQGSLDLPAPERLSLRQVPPRDGIQEASC